MSRSTLTSALAALALAVTGVGAGVGAATGSPAATGERPADAHAQTLLKGLSSPLSTAVGADGTRYVTENFAGVLKAQRPGRRARVVHRGAKGLEVGAVSEHRGRVRFALSANQRRAILMGVDRRGRTSRLADLGRHEQTRNPDARVTYGFRHLPPGCAAQLPDGMPATYRGILESHPYATLLAPSGTTFVADAAANAVLAVSPRGRVRTVAVLPPVPLRIEAGFAEQAEMPECVVGRTYRFESVPTDVERGPDGKLFVSTLPGGPEDGSLGAAASVYRVNPRNGKVTKVAGGLVSATGLAVARNGDIYVAELFRGRISRVAAGRRTPHTVLRVPFPGDVEIGPRGLFATVDVLSGLSGEPGDRPAGRLVRIRR